MVMKRLWWPYIFMLALVLILPPTLAPSPNANVSTNQRYRVDRACPPRPPPEFDYFSSLGVYTPWWIEYEDYEDYGFERVQFPLGGPSSTNESLQNVIVNFPITQGLFNKTAYDLWVHYERSQDSWYEWIRQNPNLVDMGGIYMESNTSSPVLALVADGWDSDPLTVVNLWSQMRGGIPITTWYGKMGPMDVVSVGLAESSAPV
jgi:hypothetical protein